MLKTQSFPIYDGCNQLIKGIWKENKESEELECQIPSPAQSRMDAIG